MSFIDYFRSSRKETADVAKERLQIIIAHERAQKDNPDFLPLMQREIVEVIAKYVNIDQEQVSVALDRVGDSAVLELNVIIPDSSELN